MTRPRMILFNYGGTLMAEPDHCPTNGSRAIWPYVCRDPHQTGFEAFNAYLLAFFDEIRAAQGPLIEIHEHTFLRNVLAHFDMELSVSIEEAEWIIWNGISRAVPMPGASEMLAALRRMGIRTGIISNLCWSGQALTRRVTEGFPGHPFDFIMTSSEYIFRKPDRHIFDMAIRKSGLAAADIWYCGNDLTADVLGAHGAGMTPVFYDDRRVPSNVRERNDQMDIDVPYLTIGRWEELAALLLDAE